MYVLIKSYLHITIHVGAIKAILNVAKGRAALKNFAHYPSANPTHITKPRPPVSIFFPSILNIIPFYGSQRVNEIKPA